MLFFLTGSLGLCWALMYAQLFLIKKPRNYLVNKFTFFDTIFQATEKHTEIHGWSEERITFA